MDTSTVYSAQGFAELLRSCLEVNVLSGQDVDQMLKAMSVKERAHGTFTVVNDVALLSPLMTSTFRPGSLITLAVTSNPSGSASSSPGAATTSTALCARRHSDSGFTLPSDPPTGSWLRAAGVGGSASVPTPQGGAARSTSRSRSPSLQRVMLTTPQLVSGQPPMTRVMTCWVGQRSSWLCGGPAAPALVQLNVEDEESLGHAAVLSLHAMRLLGVEEGAEVAIHGHSDVGPAKSVVLRVVSAVVGKEHSLDDYLRHFIAPFFLRQTRAISVGEEFELKHHDHGSLHVAVSEVDSSDGCGIVVDSTHFRLTVVPEQVPNIQGRGVPAQVPRVASHRPSPVYSRAPSGGRPASATTGSRPRRGSSAALQLRQPSLSAHQESISTSEQLDDADADQRSRLQLLSQGSSSIPASGTPHRRPTHVMSASPGPKEPNGSRGESESRQPGSDHDGSVAARPVFEPSRKRRDSLPPQPSEARTTPSVAARRLKPQTTTQRNPLPEYTPQMPSGGGAHDLPPLARCTKPSLVPTEPTEPVAALTVTPWHQQAPPPARLRREPRTVPGAGHPSQQGRHEVPPRQQLPPADPVAHGPGRGVPLERAIQTPPVHPVHQSIAAESPKMWVETAVQTDAEAIDTEEAPSVKNGDIVNTEVDVALPAGEALEAERSQREEPRARSSASLSEVESTEPAGTARRRSPEPIATQPGMAPMVRSELRSPTPPAVANSTPEDTHGLQKKNVILSPSPIPPLEPESASHPSTSRRKDAVMAPRNVMAPSRTGLQAPLLSRPPTPHMVPASAQPALRNPPPPESPTNDKPVSSPMRSLITSPSQQDDDGRVAEGRPSPSAHPAASVTGSSPKPSRRTTPVVAPPPPEELLAHSGASPAVYVNGDALRTGPPLVSGVDAAPSGAKNSQIDSAADSATHAMLENTMSPGHASKPTGLPGAAAVSLEPRGERHTGADGNSDTEASKLSPLTPDRGTRSPSPVQRELLNAPDCLTEVPPPPPSGGPSRAEISTAGTACTDPPCEADDTTVAAQGVEVVVPSETGSAAATASSRSSATGASASPVPPNPALDESRPSPQGSPETSPTKRNARENLQDLLQRWESLKQGWRALPVHRLVTLSSKDVITRYQKFLALTKELQQQHVNLRQFLLSPLAHCARGGYVVKVSLLTVDTPGKQQRFGAALPANSPLRFVPPKPLTSVSQPASCSSGTESMKMETEMFESMNVNDMEAILSQKVLHIFRAYGTCPSLYCTLAEPYEGPMTVFVNNWVCPAEELTRTIAEDLEMARANTLAEWKSAAGEWAAVARSLEHYDRRVQRSAQQSGEHSWPGASPALTFPRYHDATKELYAAMSLAIHRHGDIVDEDLADAALSALEELQETYYLFSQLLKPFLSQGVSRMFVIAAIATPDERLTAFIEASRVAQDLEENCDDEEVVEAAAAAEQEAFAELVRVNLVPMTDMWWTTK